VETDRNSAANKEILGCNGGVSQHLCKNVCLFCLFVKNQIVTPVKGNRSFIRRQKIKHHQYYNQVVLDVNVF
jgi:hypothetical protein